MNYGIELDTHVVGDYPLTHRPLVAVNGTTLGLLNRKCQAFLITTDFVFFIHYTHSGLEYPDFINIYLNRANIGQ